MKLDKKDMTSIIVNKYLRYDEVTGYLYRKYKYHNNVIVGKRACRPCGNKKQNHLDVTLCGRNYPAHRLVWLMKVGTFPKNHIDHIDHDEYNNKWCNLRDITQSENNRNSSKRCDNTSGTIGVWINKANRYRKFMAEIKDVKGKKIVKSFYTLEEAKAQRTLWEIEFNYHPNHGISKK